VRVTSKGIARREAGPDLVVLRVVVEENGPVERLAHEEGNVPLEEPAAQRIPPERREERAVKRLLERLCVDGKPENRDAAELRSEPEDDEKPIRIELQASRVQRVRLRTER